MGPYLIIAVLGALSLDAPAQQHTFAAAGPTDPAARVPRTGYRSAFENYVPYREQPVAPWRELNEEVARIGGHAGSLRDADRLELRPPTAEAPGGIGAAGRAQMHAIPQGAAGTRPAGGHHGR